MDANLASTWGGGVAKGAHLSGNGGHGSGGIEDEVFVAEILGETGFASTPLHPQYSGRRREREREST
jgi:hypothetical protein